MRTNKIISRNHSIPIVTLTLSNLEYNRPNSNDVISLKKIKKITQLGQDTMPYPRYGQDRRNERREDNNVSIYDKPFELLV